MAIAGSIDLHFAAKWADILGKSAWVRYAWMGNSGVMLVTSNDNPYHTRIKVNLEPAPEKGTIHAVVDRLTDELVDVVVALAAIKQTTSLPISRLTDNRVFTHLPENVKSVVIF